MLFAPVCGYLGDRFNRKLIMAAGLSVWVVAVFTSSLVPPKVRFPHTDIIFRFKEYFSLFFSTFVLFYFLFDNNAI